MSVFDSFFPSTFVAARPDDAPDEPPIAAIPSSSGGCGCGCDANGGGAPRAAASEGAKDAEALERSLNRWTLVKPGSVAVFQDFGLDACCGGDRSLAEACRIHGLDVQVVLGRLQAI